MNRPIPRVGPLRSAWTTCSEVASTTFLGLTIRCARCHDHKFEPFSQKDYYRLLAVFEPLKRPQDKRREGPRSPGRHRRRIGGRTAPPWKRRIRPSGGSRETSAKHGRRFSTGLFEKAAGGPEDLSFLNHAETVLAFQKDEKQRSDRQKGVGREVRKAARHRHSAGSQRRRSDQARRMEPEGRGHRSLTAGRAAAGLHLVRRHLDPTRYAPVCARRHHPARRCRISFDAGGPGARLP